MTIYKTRDRIKKKITITVKKRCFGIRFKIKEDFFKMKSAIAILLALSMVFAAFADEPATNYSVAEFSGSASLEWISDLEAETNGFANATEANLKINLLNGGDKATSGDGVWGELKIKIDTPDALTTPGDLTIDKTAAVDTAKIHFVDGDVGIALNILAPGLGIGDVVLPTATGADVKSQAYDPAGATLTNGFALEITSSVIDANFKVKDNGVAAEKEWGFGADAAIKAVDNMNLKAAFSFADEKVAFGASADYKLAIDDALYLKPVVAFAMMDEAKELAAGALFGWGADGQEPGFKWVTDKCADGVSVTFKTALNDADPVVAIRLYDSTLLDGLKVGAEFLLPGKVLNAGVKYGTDIDILSIALGFDYTSNFEAETNNLAWSVELSTDDVIDNTNLYAKYEGEKDNNGKITVGAKISL